MASIGFMAFLTFTQWVRALRARLHLFRLAQLRCFLLAENDYAASSRLAGRAEKSTLGHVQLSFLGLTTLQVEYVGIVLVRYTTV